METFRPEFPRLLLGISVLFGGLCSRGSVPDIFHLIIGHCENFGFIYVSSSKDKIVLVIDNINNSYIDLADSH